MSVLAQAPVAEVEAHWRAVANPPPYRMLRWPETGLVMVRGRAGGTGTRFNVGEMTVTRCAVQLEAAPWVSRTCAAAIGGTPSWPPCSMRCFKIRRGAMRSSERS